MESSPSLYQWLLLAFLAVFLTTVAATPFNITRLLEGRQSTSPGIASKASLKDFKTRYYPQTLDHFNYRSESYQIFRQRYVLYDKYWTEKYGAKSSTPIFAYLGDESSLDSRIGILQDYAANFNALLVYIEHRYYGNSIPLETNSLGYLNSAQALADYAEILISIKERYNAPESPIIVIGGSYGGMLAYWFRLKYPHIALGALASSAPILYLDDITRQNNIILAISKIFKEASNDCYQTIKRSWSEIDAAASPPKGLIQLSNKFKTCRELRSSFELKNYLESLYMKAAQSGQQVVKKMCESIDKTPDEGEDATLNKIFAGVVAALSDDTECYVNPPSPSDKAWMWQRCTELIMVMLKGQGTSETMFEAAPPNQIDLITKECQSKYNVNPRPHWLTTYYGGHNMQLILERFGSNIIFYNGMKDPYSRGGLLHEISQTIHVVKEEQGGHCDDIFPNTNTDTKLLQTVRKVEFAIIKGWIAQYETDRKSSSN